MAAWCGSLRRSCAGGVKPAAARPLGVLTHHLVHDEIAWLFLEGLFEATAGNPACRWASIRDLI